MKLLKLLSIVVLSFAVTTQSFGEIIGPPDDSSSFGHNPDHLGRKLETHFWNLVLFKNVEGLTNLISPIFQYGSNAGFMNRYQTITFLVNSTLTGFSIKELHATRYGLADVLVVSYRFLPVGSSLPKQRIISVWRKGDHNWKLVSQSSLPDF